MFHVSFGVWDDGRSFHFILHGIDEAEVMKTTNTRLSELIEICEKARPQAWTIVQHRGAGNIFRIDDSMTANEFVAHQSSNLHYLQTMTPGLMLALLKSWGEIYRALQMEDKAGFDKWATHHSMPYPSRESFFYGAHQTYCHFRGKAIEVLMGADKALSNE